MLAHIKNLAKIELSPRGLAHGPEIFRVDATFMAAHFPPRLVLGPNPTELFPETAESKPISEK